MTQDQNHSVHASTEAGATLLLQPAHGGQDPRMAVFHHDGMETVPRIVQRGWTW